MNTAKIFLLVILILSTYIAPVAQQLSTFSDSLYTFSSALPPDAIDLSPTTLPYCCNNGQKVDFGIITYHHWCYIIIKLANTGHNKYILSVDNTSIDSVMLFQISGNGTKSQAYIDGNLVPYNRNRKYVWHTMPLKGDSEVSYYLAAFQDQGRNINVGYKIMAADDLDKRYAGFDRLIWFYLGVVFLILIAVIYGWLIFKNIALGYYTLYILSVTAWILGHYGYLYPMLYPGVPVLNSIAKPLSISCSLLFFCALLYSLFRDILRQDNISRAILKWILWSGAVTTATIIFYPALPNGVYVPAIFNIGWNSFFAISFFGILLVLLRLLKKSVTVRLIALAMGVMTTMAIQQMLSNSGFFYNELLNEHGMLLASIAEMLLLTCATFLTIMEDRKRISKQVTQLTEEHSRTLQQLVMVQDNERKRIAGELHDSIGPMLAAIKINFQRVVKAKSLNILGDPLIEKTGDIIDSSMNDIREISHQLMPKELSVKGLAASLSEYIHNLREVYDIPIEFTHNITVALKSDTQLNVYRIISELILNAAKHSKASAINASIETPDGSITIVVQDDGIGFDPAQRGDSSFGLKNIESRVGYLKGTIHVVTSPGRGTRITITVPPCSK